MVVEEIKNIQCGKIELRKFGLTIGIVLGLLGGLYYFREKDFYTYFIILSSFLVLSGLVFPMVLKPIYKVWMSFAIVMGWVMTRVILILLFYFVITPISFVARLGGKDFLNIRFNRRENSYWIPKEEKTMEKRDYERQY